MPIQILGRMIFFLLIFSYLSVLWVIEACTDDKYNGCYPPHHTHTHTHTHTHMTDPPTESDRLRGEHCHISSKSFWSKDVTYNWKRTRKVTMFIQKIHFFSLTYQIYFSEHTLKDTKAVPADVSWSDVILSAWSLVFGVWYNRERKTSRMVRGSLLYCTP